MILHQNECGINGTAIPYYYPLLRSILVIAGAALLAIVMILLISATASATCTPPASGDWNIVNGDTCIKNSGTIDVQGNLLVQNGGSLTLNGVSLNMVSTADGQRKIEVQNGGTLNIRSSSTVSSSNTNFEYHFIILSGATVDIKDSTVEECGYGPMSDDAVGMRIESDSVTITGSTFRNNYAGAFVKNADPKIDNSTFENNRFGILCTASSNPEIYDNTFRFNTEAMYCIDSKPKVINNDILDSTETGIYLLRSDATLKGNFIQRNLYGIGTLASSPNITNNNISFNNDAIRAFQGDPVIEKNEMALNSRYAAWMVHTGGRIQDNDIIGSLDWNISTLYGIHLQGATTAIKDNRIYNIQLYGIRLAAGTDVVISGNDLFADYAATIWIEASKVMIRDNNISYAYVGIQYATCEGIIDGNTFYQNRDAIEGGFTNQSLRISNNTFKQNKRTGISLGESHPLIKDNTFDGNTRGIKTMYSHPSIISNSFFNNSYGIDISDHSDIYFADNLVMHGNYTVFASRATATMVNNTIKFSANYSIYLSNGSYAKLMDNRISGNDRRGVYFLNSDGILINNTISDSGTGVYATKALISFERNTFMNTDVGLFLNRTDFDMDGDTIEASSVMGIVASGGTARIVGVLVNDSKDGIYLNNINLKMINTTVSNGSKGISLYYSQPAFVSSSSFLSIADEGIYLMKTTLTVHDSIFDDDKYGIRTVDSSISITGSNFSLGSQGIHIEHASLDVQNCGFENINDTGIDAFEADLTVKDSSFRNNSAGMHLENVTVNIMDSEFLYNAEEGIRVNGTNIDVRDTRFIGNLDGLFDLGGSSMMITDCNMSSNEVFGLYTDDSTVVSDIIITRKLVLQDNNFLIRGELKVTDGGHVIFLRSPIEWYVTTPGDAGARIETGGRLVLRETIMQTHYKDAKLYKDHGYYFNAQQGSSLTIINSTVRHCGWGLSGTSAGMLVETYYTDIEDTLFENNSVGLYVYRTSFNGSDIRFSMNSIAIKVEEGSIYLVNSTIKDSIDYDVSLSFSTAELLNTKITFTKILIGDDGSILTMMWFLDVSVTWNDGQPVQGANVMVTDRKGNVLSRQADDQGYVRWLVVKEYQQKGSSPSGYFAFTPHTINATEKGLSVEVSDYISSSMSINIVMVDDTPPVVAILSPADGSIQYNSEVLVIGTASDIASDIVAVDVSVDGVTWLPALGTTDWAINLTVPEGIHTIMARATDGRGNIYTTNISTEVDLSSPMLEVGFPYDGLITSSSALLVTGKVHLGSGLIINNDTVTVKENGTFELWVGLTEGPNPIHIKALKGFEEMEVLIVVTLDTKAPTIELLHPEPGSWLNRSLVTVTVSSKEEVSFFVDDIEVDTFGGVADLIMELKEGVNIINVRAVDRAGNTNLTNFTITLDLTRPELLVEKPNNPVFSTSKERLLIQGRTEKGANLTLNGEPVTVAPDGSFSFKEKLRIGKNKFNLISKDEAGNQNMVVLEVKRDEIVDNSNYYWLLALAIIVGIALDVGTFILITRSHGIGSKGGKEGTYDREREPQVERSENEVAEVAESSTERIRPRREPRRAKKQEPDTGEMMVEPEGEFEELDMEEF